MNAVMCSRGVSASHRKKTTLTMQLKSWTCQPRREALQYQAMALRCRTEVLQCEAQAEASQCKPEASQFTPTEASQYKFRSRLLPQRVCCPQLCAMPVQHLRAPEQALEDTSPKKIDVTSKSPVGDISVVTLIRTDTTLDHSQKAEKVWIRHDQLSRHIGLTPPAHVSQQVRPGHGNICAWAARERLRFSMRSEIYFAVSAGRNANGPVHRGTLP